MHPGVRISCQTCGCRLQRPSSCMSVNVKTREHFKTIHLLYFQCQRGTKVFSSSIFSILASSQPKRMRASAFVSVARSIQTCMSDSAMNGGYSTISRGCAASGQQGCFGIHGLCVVIEPFTFFPKRHRKSICQPPVNDSKHWRVL